MSDIVSKATPEQQAEAEKIGWMPPERYKGAAELFVDADTYIERGHTILPIVKETNRRLQEELKGLQQAHTQTQQALATAQAAIDSLEERHTVETQKAVAEARKQLKEQLAQASAEGKHTEMAELTEQLVNLNAAEKKEAPAPAPAPAPAVYVPPPDLVEWQTRNTWFGVDKRKTALALAIGQELREAGEAAQGAAFYNLVSKELEKIFVPTEPPSDKVMGARGGAEGNRGGAKSYSSLPQDAKDACEADVKRFVGKDKKYKTPDAWRTRYAEIYYNEGA